MDFTTIWHLFSILCVTVCILSLIFYLVPIVYLSVIARPQDLRKNYGDWAVVTGGSSGIGKAVARKLAAQVCRH